MKKLKKRKKRNEGKMRGKGRRKKKKEGRKMSREEVIPYFMDFDGDRRLIDRMG
jgi:hypothetical protein